MTELEVLRAARERVGCQEHWCGSGWGYSGRECLLHAVYAADGYCFDDDRAFFEPENYPTACSAQAILRRELGEYPGSFNDTHSHAEVLALLDTVIAKLEEQSYGPELPPLPVTTKEKVMA